VSYRGSYVNEEDDGEEIRYVKESRDLVCGTEVEAGSAAATRGYKGETLHR
jgi:hypothetical protein